MYKRIYFRLFSLPSRLHEVLIRLSLAACFYDLARLQESYFVCYSEVDYFSKRSNYEKNIYQKRSAWLTKMKWARYFLNKSKRKNTKWHLIFSELEQLSEVVFSLHQLRFRAEEYAIFDICSIEMKSLRIASTIALHEAAKKMLWSSQSNRSAELLKAINAFENIFDRILKISLPGPIIFLFFIQNLLTLNEKLNGIYEETI